MTGFDGANLGQYQRAMTRLRRVLDRYEEGFTIGGALADASDGDLADPAFRDAVEAAVLRVLEDGRPELAAA